MIYSTKTLLASALVLRVGASGSGSGSGSGTEIISGSGSGSGFSGSGSGSMSGSGSGGGGGSSAICSDYAGWMDELGASCGSYDTSECNGAVSSDGSPHAGEACCVCGGGLLTGSFWFIEAPNMGCQTKLSASECEQAAVEAGTAFSSDNNANIPHGCIHQVIDNVFIYNQVGTYMTNDGMDWHERDWCPQGVEDVCIIRGVCGPDWWETRKDGTSCPEGMHLSQMDCQLVFETNHMFFDGDKDFNRASPDLPQGCYGDRTYMGGGWNQNPNGALADFDSGEDGYFYWPFCAREQGSPTPMPTAPVVFPTPSPTAPMTTEAPVEDKTVEFVLQNKHGGFCFDAKNRRDRGGTVHMWECQQKGEAFDWNRNQHWDMKVMREDLHSVSGMVKSHDGICLDASEARNGGKVWMWPCKSGNMRQMWTYEKVSGQFRSHNGEYCLDARQRMTPGGYVHMWACLPGNKNQQFHMLQNPENFPYVSKMDYSENILQTGTWSGDSNVMPPPPVAVDPVPFLKKSR